MNDFDYFAVPALSASLAKKLAISAAHGREFMLNPPKQTPAMAFGTAVHATILEPHRQDVFVVRPDDLDRRTKDGKRATPNLKPPVWRSSRRRKQMPSNASAITS